MTPPPLPSYWAVPAKLLAGAYPGDRDPARSAARLQALLESGVSHVVNLMESRERDWLYRRFTDYRPQLRILAARIGACAETVRRPIPDMQAPTVAEMRDTLDWIDAAIAAGGTVYVHCLAGKGRTGTVVGCYLARHRLAVGKEALDHLLTLALSAGRHFWPTPQTPQQRELVLHWAAGQ